MDVLVLLDDASRAEVNEVAGLAADAGLVDDSFVCLSRFVRTPETFASLRQRELGIALDIDREGIRPPEWGATARTF